MFDNAGSDTFAKIIAICVFVYFALVAWVHLDSTVPTWVRKATGIAALVLAVAALLALL